jgi:predicted acetyltransferase
MPLRGPARCAVPGAVPGRRSPCPLAVLQHGRCDGRVEVRRIDADERSAISVPIQAYAFHASPVPGEVLDRLRSDQKYYQEHVTLVAETGGQPVADASAIPMRQNVRGVIYPMAGIAGVATLPHARRRGYASTLVAEILGLMRDSGHVVSALHPFRQSFYTRFGFIGLPQTRTVMFPISSVTRLLTTDLDGTVRWGPVAEHYDEYLAYTNQLLADRHGFALLPESRTSQLRDSGDRWLAIAAVNDTVVGAITYRITGFGGDLIADDLLVSGPLGRALLLRFFAGHADQVSGVQANVPADEMPELWATDFASETRAITSFPVSPAPMARVLSLTGLAGMPVGNGRATVEVVDDRFIAGRYSLDGTMGVLDVRRVAAVAADATLTSAGLSGLIYGVLDPGELGIRGFGQAQGDVLVQLRRLFPPSVPHLHASF